MTTETLPEKIISINQKDMAKLIGVSVKTLNNWDRDKTFVARRTPNNRPFYTVADYQRYFDEALKRAEE